MIGSSTSVPKERTTNLANREETRLQRSLSISAPSSPGVSKIKLKGRVTRNNTLRLSVHHKEFFEQPPESPKAKDTVVQAKEPTFIETLKQFFNEKDSANKPKITNEYGLDLEGTQLKWKAIEKGVFGVVKHKKEIKEAAFKAMTYIRNELAKLVTAKSQDASYKDLTDIYTTLKTNKICLKVFQKNPDLSTGFRQLMLNSNRQ